MASGAFCILILLRESGWLQALVARSISWNQIGPMHSEPGPRIQRKLQIFQMRSTSDPGKANMEEFSKYQARNL